MTQPPTAPRRPPARLTKRRPIRVAVLYNVDFEDTGPDGDPGYAARADVEVVARAIAATLSDGAHEAHLVPVDGDMHELRTRLLELEPDCAFNLCESLAGDARLETAVPLLVELLGIPCTGSSPEALSQALGDRRGLTRYGEARVPMDEALAYAVVDLSGRATANISISPDPGMAAHMFTSLAQTARMTLHVTATGENAHHVAEASFKAVGRALAQAMTRDGTLVRSTKGSL